MKGLVLLLCYVVIAACFFVSKSPSSKHFIFVPFLVINVFNFPCYCFVRCSYAFHFLKLQPKPIQRTQWRNGQLCLISSHVFSNTFYREVRTVLFSSFKILCFIHFIYFSLLTFGLTLSLTMKLVSSLYNFLLSCKLYCTQWASPTEPRWFIW